MTASKLHSSQEFSRSRGEQPLRHVLVPKTKAVIATLEALRDSIDAVIDVTLGYTIGEQDVSMHVIDVHYRRTRCEYACDRCTL